MHAVAVCFVQNEQTSVGYLEKGILTEPYSAMPFSAVSSDVNTGRQAPVQAVTSLTMPNSMACIRSFDRLTPMILVRGCASKG